jgi:glycerophosphoryl diester phosphodiesterase
VPGLERGHGARPALKRVGHKGADLIAPGNTLESFDAALSAGVDMVEFDVLPETLDGRGRLVLAHDLNDAARRTPLTLEQGLAHFLTDAWAGVELVIDLKLPGYEARVVRAVRDHGLARRALISTMETRSLDVLRAAAPEIRVGWSVPRVRRDVMAHPVTRVAALAAARYGRAVIPRRVGAALRARRIDAVMAHWAVVGPWLVRAVGRAGGELYVWTVDDAEHIARLERLGVTGVITNDPRLFGPVRTSP